MAQQHDALARIRTTAASQVWLDEQGCRFPVPVPGPITRLCWFQLTIMTIGAVIAIEKPSAPLSVI